MIIATQTLRKLIKNNLYIYSILFILINNSCIGYFATTEKLSYEYSHTANDENLTLFYNYNNTFMNVAVKNTGTSFMRNLNISFNCISDSKTNSKLFSLGELKPYFNKTIKLIVDFNECAYFTAEYTFLPIKDGDFIDNRIKTTNFVKSPVYPVEKVIILK